MSTTPASFPQVAKLYDVLGGISVDDMQYLLENGDLLKNLSKNARYLRNIDRSAFNIILEEASGPIEWTPVSRYVGKLHEWNVWLDLGVKSNLIDELDFPDHRSRFQPTSISMRLSDDLRYDIEAIYSIISYECRKQNLPTPSFDSHASGLTEPYVNMRYREPTPARLRIATCSSHEDRTDFLQGPSVNSLAGIEVFWLMALNPIYFFSPVSTDTYRYDAYVSGIRSNLDGKYLALNTSNARQRDLSILYGDVYQEVNFVTYG